MIVSMYMDEALGDIQLAPEMGTVAFGSSAEIFAVFSQHVLELFWFFLFNYFLMF